MSGIERIAAERLPCETCGGSGETYDEWAPLNRRPCSSCDGMGKSAAEAVALALTIGEAEALRSMAHWILDERADVLLTPGELSAAHNACRKLEDALSAASPPSFLDALRTLTDQEVKK